MHEIEQIEKAAAWAYAILVLTMLVAGATTYVFIHHLLARPLAKLAVTIDSLRVDDIQPDCVAEIKRLTG